MRYINFFQASICAASIFFALSARAQATDRPTVVSFEMRGNSIFVQAQVNGQRGSFLIDTGVPNLILNSTHFEGVRMAGSGAGITDLHGANSETLLLAIEAFSMGELVFKEKYAHVADLQSIATIKGISLFGIIGYSTLKNFELHFDFELQALTFFSLGKKGEPTVATWQEVPTEILDLKFSGHIPYVITMVGEKKLRLGIDSGSEVNLLNDRFYEKSDLTMTDARSIQIHGLSGDRSEAERGNLAGIPLEDFIAGPMDITLADLRTVNESLPVNLDGLLGIAYFKKVRFSINYKKRELCIWSQVPELGPLAERTPPDGMEATLAEPKQ